jgi:hypothetical protein
MDHFGFWVSDLNAWVRKMLDVGGRVKVRPYNTGIVILPRPFFNRRAAYVANPDGIWAELMTREAEGANLLGDGAIEGRM